MNNWQKIISNFLRYIPYSEKEYQERIVSILVSIGLGWEDENIEQQLSLNLGSTQRVVPDIVLTQNSSPVIIIEIKPNHHKQQEKDILQLISYMKQLEINIGVYFGEKVEVYYKELGSNNLPLKLLDIQLTADDPKWELFVGMFSKESFSTENVNSYYINKLRKIKEESEVLKLTTELTSNGKVIIEEALKNHLLKLGYESSTIRQAIEKLNISVRPQAIMSSINIPDSPKVFSELTSRHQGKAAFSINGNGEYGVGKLALTIVSMVSANNPDMSYEDLKRTFNTWRENIKTIEEINIWKSSTSDKSKDTRWFEKYPIKSNDGVVFAVSTQWGIFNIENIIRTGVKQGLTIERIR